MDFGGLDLWGGGDFCIVKSAEKLVAIQSVPPPFAEGARGWVNPTSASQAKSATANKHSTSVIARKSAGILVAIQKFAIFVIARIAKRFVAIYAFFLTFGLPRKSFDLLAMTIMACEFVDCHAHFIRSQNKRSEVSLESLWLL